MFGLSILNYVFQFSFENCKFRIQRSKEGTGRVVVWMLGVANSYTMEASFGGSELGGRMSTHFSVQDYESLGKTFCETLLDFYDEDPSKERLRNKIVTRLLKEGSNADEPTNIDLSDYSRYVLNRYLIKIITLHRYRLTAMSHLQLIDQDFNFQ